MDNIRICFLVGSVILGLNRRVNASSGCVRHKDFQCDGPHFRCVDRYRLCDGRVDCNDQTDEDKAACDFLNKGVCPKGFFKCNYGACLPDITRCNRHLDCWDNSDEAGCPAHVGVETDRLWEEESMSTTSPTPPKEPAGPMPNQGQPAKAPPAFRPQATNVPPQQQVTDTAFFRPQAPNFPTQEPAIVSAPYSTPLTVPPPRATSASQDANGNNRPCEVPELAMNRQFSTFKSQITPVAPGSYVQQSGLLIVACDDGFRFEKDEVRQFITNCTNGRWFQEIPQCLKVCPKLTSTSASMQCSTQRGCDSPMSLGTRVSFQCKDFWDFSGSYNNQPVEITCQDNGEWSGPVPECVPRCGVSSMDIYQDSGSPKLGHFPWFAGVYRVDQSSTNPLCTGTLVSLRVVVTAAHCLAFTPNDAAPMRPTSFRVALGKFFRDWNVTENTEQRFKIETLTLHPDYRGSASWWGCDIALLVLDRDVEVSAYVMPACIDYTRRFYDAMIADKNVLGHIAGWGKMKECSGDVQQCESLSYTRLPTLSRDECSQVTQLLSKEKGNQLTTDKYCVGNGTGPVFHRGNNGGGHTVPFLGDHYLFGVVSTTIGQDPGPVYGGLTDVRFYLRWLKENIEAWKKAGSEVDFRLNKSK